jgi:hypothetical protein
VRYAESKDKWEQRTLIFNIVLHDTDGRPGDDTTFFSSFIYFAVSIPILPQKEEAAFSDNLFSNIDPVPCLWGFF